MFCLMEEGLKYQTLKRLRWGSRELFLINGNTGTLPCTSFFSLFDHPDSPSCSTEELLFQNKLHPDPPGILCLVVLPAMVQEHINPLIQNTSGSSCDTYTDTPLSKTGVGATVATSTQWADSVPVKSAFPTTHTTGRAWENALNICSSQETEETA